jgi:ribosomal protein L16 Arg81 hydroxylase
MLRTPNKEFNLPHLIAPISEDNFRNSYWEQKPLIVKRQDPKYYSDLFSLHSLDELLARFSVLSPSILVVKDGSDLPLSRIVPEGMDKLSIECILNEYSKGATLVFPQIQESSPELKSLCFSLSTDCSARFQVNGYLTPKQAQGLGVHYDTHDVFVLQIAGTKHWSICDSPARLPLATQPFVRDSNNYPEAVDEFDLVPGDLLYLPRGVVHEAVSRDELSLHLTIGIMPILWADLLLSLLHSAIEQNPNYRESLPLGFARRDAQQSKIQTDLRRLMRKLSKEADYESAVENARSAARLTAPITVRGRLHDLEALKDLSRESSVSVRDNVEWWMERRGNEICLSFLGKEVYVPSRAEEILEFIKDVAGPFSAGQLPESLNENGRITLVRRLVKEGLLLIGDVATAQNQ